MSTTTGSKPFRSRLRAEVATRSPVRWPTCSPKSWSASERRCWTGRCCCSTTSTAEQYEIDLLTVSILDLDRALGAASDGRIRFTGSSPVSPVADRFWRSTQAHVASIRTDPAMLPSPSVDAAISFIETEAHRPIDLTDIAAAAGTGPTALTRAFRARQGLTPLQHLRMVRMQRARADLAAADAWGTTTVREVAARWGFHQGGRFAQEYTRRFGEPPSATLRR